MRTTRAAMRAQAQDEFQLIHEDAEADSFHTPPDNDANQDINRPPLKDITIETNPPTNEDPFTEESTTMQNKSKRKGKSAKKDKSEVEVVEVGHEVVQTAINEDTIDSSQTLSSEESAGSQTLSAFDSTEQAVHNNEASIEAVDATLEEQATSTPEHIHTDPPKTPKFDPSIHKPVEGIATPAADSSEDSFVEKITSRTPGRMLSFQEESQSPKSIIEPIPSRAPRIEDSVDAMDALDDAIEKVADTLPALEEMKIESPVKSRRNTPARLSLQSNALTPATSKKPIPSPARNQRVSPTKTRPATKPTDPPRRMSTRPSSVKHAVKPAVVSKVAKKPLTDGQKPRQSFAQLAAPALSFSNSPAKSLPSVIKKRVPSENLSTSKPAFVPAKSSKPPTKSTFALPGEAIAAKLKTQREERLKREEDAEKEKKVFKARPAPTKVARPSVVPRENKASQARMSIYANGVNKENVSPKPATNIQPKARPTSLDSKPKASKAAVAKANSGVRRITTSTIAPKPRVSSLQLTTGQKSTVTKQDTVQQKVKGKEVFSRTKADLERAEKERKEKEEGTRKARAEAAEKGRQASREWAEKQKKKIAAVAQDKFQAARADEEQSYALQSKGVMEFEEQHSSSVAAAS